MPESQPRPTDAELEILTVLWSRGPATVREIHEIIAKRKPTQYTTVLKLLQIMAGKGLVRRDEKQRAHVYEAASTSEATRKQLAGDLLRRAFNDSAALLVQGALASRKASKSEIADIRKLLDEYEKGRKP
ncbi:MAG TPA: BlaI/MecI/CopY family transcriptional regulator [Bryobacteraceae bacterium]|jgi:predicted transcriptional regulator|nr:BlaI/MecI/CopY family transcriptional regulator [Bryobacteraceae bacterium]